MAEESADGSDCPSPRWLTRRRKLVLSVVPIFTLVLAVAVGSFAAWTVTLSNSGNTFSTTTVLLQDNQGGSGGSTVSSGTAMFNVNNLEPNSLATEKCMGVVFSGDPAATLTLAATLGGAGQAALQGQLTMDVARYNTSGTVTVGGANNNGSCGSYPGAGTNTTIGTQGATLAAWAAGGPYPIASPVTNTWYQFTVSGLPPTASDCATYCGKTITVALTWTLTTS